MPDKAAWLELPRPAEAGQKRYSVVLRSHLDDAPLAAPLAISGLAFAVLFLQTGLDLARAGLGSPLRSVALTPVGIIYTQRDGQPAAGADDTRAAPCWAESSHGGHSSVRAHLPCGPQAQHLQLVTEQGLVQAGRLGEGSEPVYTFGEAGRRLGNEFMRTWWSATGIKVRAASENGGRPVYRAFLAPTALANHLFTLEGEPGGLRRALWAAHPRAARPEMTDAPGDDGCPGARPRAGRRPMPFLWGHAGRWGALLWPVWRSHKSTASKLKGEGKMTESPKYCGQCGAVLSPEVRFREACGHLVAVAQAPSKRAALAVIAVVAIVIVVVAGVRCSTITPTMTPPTTVAPSARIVRFAVSPAEVKPGDPVTLVWEVVGEKAGVGYVQKSGVLSDAKPLPALAGNLRVNTDPLLREVQTFVLNVNTGASQAWGSAVVRLTCPDKWPFPNPPTTCPASTLRTRIVAQQFEHGLMLWTEADRRIYVLPNGRGWMPGEDKWREGMPESDPSIVPPQGLLQPVRGFGLVWRTWAGVREGLGWATGQEFVLGEGAVQEEYRVGKYPQNLYISSPGVAYYLPQTLGPSPWSLWKEPGQR